MHRTKYDYDSEYHGGTLVEQDAKAYLGIYKSIEDVPEYSRLPVYADEVDADEAWREYVYHHLSGVNEHTRRYMYCSTYEKWRDYCEFENVHSALADPDDIEGWLSKEHEENGATLKGTHDSRFRPLFRWYRWMTYHTDYPQSYQPTLMAVLLGGVTYDIWATRFDDRQTTPDRPYK